MSCCATNCKNRAANGFRLARFPSDPKRRKIWIDRCGRKNWEPSEWSKLCEVHFDSDQWEKHRVDGRRKLKPNAVPSFRYEETEAVENIENITIDETEEWNSNGTSGEIAVEQEERADSEIDGLKAQNVNLRRLIKNYSTVLRASLPQEEENGDRTIDVLKSENEQMRLLLGASSKMSVSDKRLESVQDIVLAYIFKIKREIQDDIKFLNTDYGHLREIMRLILEFVNTVPKSSSSDVVELTAVMKEMYGVMSVIVPENSKVKTLLKKFIRFLDKDFSPTTDVSVVIDIATNIHKTVQLDSEIDLLKTESEYSKLVTTDHSGSPSNVVPQEEINYRDLVKKVKNDVTVFRRICAGLKQVSKQLTTFLQAH